MKDEPETIALLALIAARALIASAKPKIRMRMLRYIALGVDDLSVIPITDGNAKRRAEALRDLYARLLPTLVDPK